MTKMISTDGSEATLKEIQDLMNAGFQVTSCQKLIRRTKSIKYEEGVKNSIQKTKNEILVYCLRQKDDPIARIGG